MPERVLHPAPVTTNRRRCRSTNAFTPARSVVAPDSWAGWGMRRAVLGLPASRRPAGVSPVQKAVHRSRKRNLNRGLYKRTNLGSARNPVDHALESSLDLIGEVRGSRFDFRLRHI